MNVYHNETKAGQIDVKYLDVIIPAVALYDDGDIVEVVEYLFIQK